MGSASGRDTAALKQRLEDEARRFEFLQAVRLLHRLAPEREALGRDAEPHDEVARLRSDISLTFPRSDIVKIEAPQDGDGPPEMTIAFLGAATPTSFGSLPTPYVELVLEQERSGNDPVLRDFLDAFNHRMASLYYRSFEKHHAAVSLETGNHDFFERALRGVIGIATPGLHERLALRDEALFSRAGLLAMAPAPVVAIESLVESYFGVPAKIEQFVPAWYALDAEECTRLGGPHATLGSDVALGASVRLSEFRFRVRVGPLGIAQYEALLPGAEGFHALFDLVRLCVSGELSFELQLVLRKEEVPVLVLSKAATGRLGRTTWLTASPGARARDADDARFASETFALERASIASNSLEGAA
jgi:type VI secretion system protein ImpH